MTARFFSNKHKIRAVIDRAYRSQGGKMKRAWVISLLMALAVSALMCGTVWAQATAQISGTVKDQSGAVLPGVEITATQTDTRIARMTVSNETGSYALPNLPIG